MESHNTLHVSWRFKGEGDHTRRGGNTGFKEALSCNIDPKNMRGDKSKMHSRWRRDHQNGNKTVSPDQLFRYGKCVRNMESKPNLGKKSLMTQVHVH